MATQLKNLKFSDKVAETDADGNLGNIRCGSVNTTSSITCGGNISCVTISPTYITIGENDYALSVDENGFVKIDGGSST